jgi:hypothetical protein
VRNSTGGHRVTGGAGYRRGAGNWRDIARGGAWRRNEAGGTWAGPSGASRAAGVASGEVVRSVGLGLVDALTAEAGSVLFGGMTSFLDSSSSMPSPTGRRPSLPSWRSREHVRLFTRESTGRCSRRRPVSGFIR